MSPDRPALAKVPHASHCSCAPCLADVRRRHLEALRRDDALLRAARREDEAGRGVVFGRIGMPKGQPKKAGPR
jgi:hypothetical protein